MGGTFSFAAPLPNLGIGARYEMGVKEEEESFDSNLPGTEEVLYTGSLREQDRRPGHRALGMGVV